MRVKFTVTRSDAWVATRRLETGDNVPKTCEVEVPVSALGQAARKILLAHGGGEYRVVFSGGFNSLYEWAYGCYHGILEPLVDADQPTLEQVEAALLEADAKLRGMREADRLEKERRREEREAEAVKKAAEAAKLAEARELLKDEIAKLEKSVAYWKAEAEAEKALNQEVEADVE